MRNGYGVFNQHNFNDLTARGFCLKTFLSLPRVERPLALFWEYRCLNDLLIVENGMIYGSES